MTTATDLMALQADITSLQATIKKLTQDRASVASAVSNTSAAVTALTTDLGTASSELAMLTTVAAALAMDINPQPPPGQAGFGQAIMSPPPGYTAAQRFFQDTFQLGILDPTKWMNTMGSVNDWGNEPGYGGGGTVSVVSTAMGGGVILDNSTGGTSGCITTCQPKGAGGKLLVTFPEAGWYIQAKMKFTPLTNGFFPALWLPPEGAGAEIDIMEGGFTEGQTNPNMDAHWDYAATGGAGNQQQGILNVAVDFTQNFVIFGCEFKAGVSCKFFVNGHEADAKPPCPGTPTYNLALTPQHTPGGSGGWHTQGAGTGKMFVAEVQAYSLA